MRRFQRFAAIAAVIGMTLSGCSQKRVDFSAEIKPILNKHCITCHGGVKRNAQFSLLFRHEAIDTAESGKRVIIPGDPDHSELMRRITSDDPELRMPYKEDALSQEEVDLLRRWIKEGAEWGDHWAYVAPKPVDIPAAVTLSGFSGSDEDWNKNAIDRFLLKNLAEHHLTPSAPADKPTLIRRVYLDLIGLPPSQSQVNSFIQDQSPDAFEKVVDELLASPRFGEKWATWWLDMARYADTKGYEKDSERSIWRYRDWVIRAFNSDMPFDQFTTEQLAGDLLPDPTDDQLIATAFHRNTMNNDEGGTDDEEFRVAAVVDRVNTTWEIWQGTTMGCVQCHTHPYDPFLHEEYYKFMAFLNNTSDQDQPGDYPKLRFYKAEDQKKLDDIKSWVREKSGVQQEKQVAHFLKTLEPKFYPMEFDELVEGALLDNKYLGIRTGGRARLKQQKMDGKAFLVMNYWQWSGNFNGTVVIRKDTPDGEVIARFTLDKAGEVALIPLTRTTGTHDLYFSFSNPKINPAWEVCAVEWLAFLDDFPDRGSPSYASMKTTFHQLLNTPVEDTPVMIETVPEYHRTTQVFIRGSWLSKGDRVSPDVPASLNAFPANAPRNRLGLSQWLLSKDNPLTSRAIVNRFWEQLYGTGLVESLEDFGTQGTAPVNQPLLDWLSLRFMNDHQWSMKKLIRDLVTTAAYQQDSHLTKALLDIDPTNRLLARGPRVRLSFEQIRDQSLAVSGLLSLKMYGKSVMPYQPAGIWSSVYSGEQWKQSAGEDQYRRSVYTFSKRTSPYPSMMMFDGSSREVCVSRRIRTNTPLQALVTLNDSSFVLAARHLARRMMDTPKTPREEINEGYKRLVFHPMSPKKLDVFEKLYNEALADFRSDASAAQKMISDEKASPELAAMTVVASALLNLDEVITKE